MNKTLLGATIVSVLTGVTLAITAFADISSGPFSAVSPSEKAAAQQQVKANRQQHDAEVLQRIKQGLPPSPTLGSQPASNNPPVAQPQIISARDLYPPVSSGVFTCTNYFNAPTLNVMVLAGAKPATPNNGTFIIAYKGQQTNVALPSGDGVPTLTGFNGVNLVFTTSTGASGTLNYQAGKISLNN